MCKTKMRKGVFQARDGSDKHHATTANLSIYLSIASRQYGARAGASRAVTAPPPHPPPPAAAILHLSRKKKRQQPEGAATGFCRRFL